MFTKISICVSLGTSLASQGLTLHGQLGTGVDGAMLVLRNALVHARVVQAQLGETQVPGQHLYPGLCRKARPRTGGGIRTARAQGGGVVERGAQWRF